MKKILSLVLLLSVGASVNAGDDKLVTSKLPLSEKSTPPKETAGFWSEFGKALHEGYQKKSKQEIEEQMKKDNVDPETKEKAMGSLDQLFEGCGNSNFPDVLKGFASLLEACKDKK